MKNQKGFSITEWFLLVAVVLIIGSVGYFVYNSNIKNKRSVINSVNTNPLGANNESASQTPQSEQNTASVSKNNTSSSSKQTTIKVIEPVSSDEFSNFGNITTGHPIYAYEPSKI